MRAALESLLRAKKLDLTLTPPGAAAPPAERLAPTGDADLDASLGGGLRRGHLSEIIGPASSGRSTLAVRALAAATARGEAAALIDTCDALDPASAAAHGVILPRLLWVRPAGRSAADVSGALKACSLVLQAGGFGLVVFDLADVTPQALRRLPWYAMASTWMRLTRIVEGSDTVVLLLGAEHIARSAGGATIALESVCPRWQGSAPRARLFTGVQPAPRLVRSR